MRNQKDLEQMGEKREREREGTVKNWEIEQKINRYETRENSTEKYNAVSQKWRRNLFAHVDVQSTHAKCNKTIANKNNM